jgi:hypothetical protein
MSAKVERAKIWEEFENIRIKHPRLVEAHDAFDDLRKLRKATPNAPQRFVALFAPTHSGKSMSVRTYLETAVATEAIARGLFSDDMDRKLIAKRQRIALHVTLSANATPKTLASDILRALGDERAESGNTPSLLARAYDLMHKIGIEILFVDEIQHLREYGISVTDTLKTMMIRGLVPMVFIGIEEARHHLFNDPQLANRCLLELDYSCLDYENQSERKLFEDYCGRLGLKLKQHELFEKAADLLADDIPACLHVVSGGRIGMVSRLVQDAATIAAEQAADTVRRHHIDEAVAVWLRKGRVKENPFRSGVRRTKVKAA